MVWFRVDDKMMSHPKVLRIPRASRLAVMGLWLAGGVWSAGQLTDGALPAYMLTELGGTKRLVAALVDAGLWIETEGGWQFHDWHEYQPTREQVENERATARERMAKLRNGSRDVRANKDRTSPEVPESSEDVRDPRPDPSIELPTEVQASPRKRGSRLTDDWLPDPSVRSEMATAHPNVNLKTEHAKFIDYWTNKPGKDGVKLDWNRTWRNWIRSAAERTPNGTARTLAAVPAYETPAKREPTW